MSMSYYMINGIGLNVSDIQPYINNEKAVKFFYENFPDDLELQEIINTSDYSSFDIEEYYYSKYCDSLAEFLCYYDTDIYSFSYANDGSFANNGKGNDYLYYSPSMPWERTNDDPKTEREVVERIIKIVQKITDMTDEEIEKVIDMDLNVLGAY